MRKTNEYEKRKRVRKSEIRKSAKEQNVPRPSSPVPRPSSHARVPLLQLQLELSFQVCCLCFFFPDPENF